MKSIGLPVGIFGVLLTLLGIVLPGPAAAVVPAIFGTREFRADSFAALPQWQRVLDRIESERAVYRACSADARACPNRGTLAWRALISSLRDAPRREQIREVNRFVNQWSYKSDDSNYGRSDYWASPLEFFGRSGDCEDYAITKYVTLRELGVPADDVRMVVLKDTLRDLAHAVLAVVQDDQVLILDNLTNAALPDHKIAHYAPYYSVNEQTRWAHVARDPAMVAALSPQAIQGKGPTRSR